MIVFYDLEAKDLEHYKNHNWYNVLGVEIIDIVAQN